MMTSGLRYFIFQTARRTGLAALIVGVLAMSAAADETPAPIRLYLDADRTNATASGDSIEAGMRAAVRMHGGEIAGRPIEFVMLDHRGNTRRSKRSLETFAADPHGLAIFAGMHSPPLLSLREMINGQKLLMLDPWAAAGPITRAKTQENWIFRLSVDDANAGEFIAQAAIEEGVRKPGLLLEDTGWGKANNGVMTRAVSEALGTEPVRRWIGWGISDQAMRLTVHELVGEGVDAIFFVGNTPEGIKLIKALAAIDEDVRPDLYSHWGILGGDLTEQVTAAEMQAVNLKFIQTRFDLEMQDEQSLVAQAFKAAQAEGFYQELDSAKDIPAPTGFVHAFDLARLLLEAIDQARLTGDIEKDRDAVRQALEDLQNPVTGIVKTYQRPFTPYKTIGSDAHEALGVADYTFAHFCPKGRVKQLPAQPREQAVEVPEGHE